MDAVAVLLGSVPESPLPVDGTAGDSVSPTVDIGDIMVVGSELTESDMVEGICVVVAAVTDARKNDSAIAGNE